MSERERFKERLESLKEKGLVGLGFAYGEPAEDPEDFYAEANRLLDAVEDDSGEPLVFNDSKLL